MSEVWQQQFIVICFKIGSCLSFGATVYVLYEVLGDRQKRCRTYFRLVAGLSFMECLESVALFCGPWCTPAWWSQKMWSASGTQESCRAQGWFIHVATTGSFLYSGMLALYYLLAIRHNMVERRIRRNVEPGMHFVTLTWAFGTATASVLLDLMRPMGTICYIGKSPPKCLETFQHGYSTCVQGDNATLYYYLFKQGMLYFVYAFTVLCLILVWYKIRSQEHRNLRYSYRTRMSDSSQATGIQPESNLHRHVSSGRPSILSSSQHQTNKSNPLSRRFATQASLYIAVMWICNIWSFISFWHKIRKGKGIVQISMTASIIKPLEGFLNTLVYMRPRWIAHLRQQQAQLQLRQQPSGLDTRQIEDSKQQTDSAELTCPSQLTLMSSQRDVTAVRQEHDNSSGDNDMNTENDQNVGDSPSPHDVLPPPRSEIETELQQDAEEQVQLGAY